MVGIAESDKRGYLRNRKRGCGKQLRCLFKSYIHNVTVNRHTCSVPEYRAEVIRVIGKHLRKPRKRQLSGVIRADIVGDPRTEPRIALRMTVGNEITGILHKCRRAVFGMLRAAEKLFCGFCQYLAEERSTVKNERGYENVLSAFVYFYYCPSSIIRHR